MKPLSKIALLIAVCMPASHAIAAPDEHSHRPVVNVFAVQSWGTLGAAEPEPPKQTTAHEEAEETFHPSSENVSTLLPHAPFEVMGQWHDNETYAVMVSRQGETFIACRSACAIDGAVFPGQAFSDGYQLKKLTKDQLVIVSSDGQRHVLALPDAALESVTHEHEK